MRIRSLLCGLIVSTALILAPIAALAAAPEAGTIAPEFAFVGQEGLTYRSADFFSPGDVAPDGSGKSRGVVIAWFPKAFTSG
jgi:hypothetical protein